MPTATDDLVDLALDPDLFAHYLADMTAGPDDPDDPDEPEPDIVFVVPA